MTGASVVKTADTVDLKSTATNVAWGFNSLRGHQQVRREQHATVIPTLRTMMKRDGKTFPLTFPFRNDKVVGMDNDTVNRNVEIRDLPRRVDDLLKAISLATGKTKLVIYREALEEYAEKYRGILGPFIHRLNTEHHHDE